ncbi:MAG: tetratricopeptide repeat protein [Candidatus Aureabacteria bacterium]|nr:tetratricopeptide repeat protein [Candidatus Auribacterota bacterium]
MKYLKTLFFVIIFILFDLSFCVAGSANDLFFQANRRYDNGNFQEAARLYEQLIERGTISGNIYYNLGNAYYKTGRRGKALLNYERAKKLIPDNEALFANMSFVNSALNVKQPEEAYTLLQKIWVGMRGVVSVRGWFFISAVLFFSICVILGIAFLKGPFRRKSRVFSVILAFFFIASLTFFVDSYNTGKRFKIGIIITDEADVRYSPSHSGMVAFKLVEGMKAQIVRRQGPWTHVRLNKEKSGWIESEAIEAVW